MNASTRGWWAASLNLRPHPARRFAGVNNEPVRIVSDVPIVATDLQGELR
jgi:hypothetical protein